MLKDLVKLATRLDEKGKHIIADQIDEIINKNAFKKDERYIVIADKLNVRSEPKISSKIKYQLDNGEEVIITNEQTVDNDNYIWIYITTDIGPSGWVATKYLKKI